MRNNAAERGVRPVAIRHKNRTSAGSDNGVHLAAGIYTLIEAVKLNDAIDNRQAATLELEARSSGKEQPRYAAIRINLAMFSTISWFSPDAYVATLEERAQNIRARPPWRVNGRSAAPPRPAAVTSWPPPTCGRGNLYPCDRFKIRNLGMGVP
jgi:hypothetical protein